MRLFAPDQRCGVLRTLPSGHFRTDEYAFSVRSHSQLKPGRRHRTARSPRNDGTVRVGILVGLPAVLRSLGADPAALAAEAGFDLGAFDDPNNGSPRSPRPSVQPVRGQYRVQALRTPARPRGALVVAGTGGLPGAALAGRGSGAVQPRAVYASDVCGGVASFAVHGNSAMVNFDVVLPHLEATDQTGDAAMAMLFNILGTLCGPEWKPVEVRFSHRKPEDAGPFRRFFRAPLRFDAEQNLIVFSTDWLRRPLPGHYPSCVCCKSMSMRPTPDTKTNFPSRCEACYEGRCYRPLQCGPDRGALLDAQPHAAAPAGRVRKQFQATRGRNPLRDRPADARRLSEACERDRRIAQLCRRERFHPGIPPMEAAPRRRSGGRSARPAALERIEQRLAHGIARGAHKPGTADKPSPPLA